MSNDLTDLLNVVLKGGAEVSSSTLRGQHTFRAFQRSSGEGIVLRPLVFSPAGHENRRRLPSFYAA